MTFRAFKTKRESYPKKAPRDDLRLEISVLSSMGFTWLIQKAGERIQKITFVYKKNICIYTKIYAAAAAV